MEGSTDQGWTLTNWAGLPVGPATLGTKLFVDVRDLVVTPQTAAYRVVRAFGGGDIRTIANAIRSGVVPVADEQITGEERGENAEPEIAAPGKKLRTARTVRKPGRPGAVSSVHAATEVKRAVRPAHAADKDAA